WAPSRLPSTDFPVQYDAVLCLYSHWSLRWAPLLTRPDYCAAHLLRLATADAASRTRAPAASRCAKGGSAQHAGALQPAPSRASNRRRKIQALDQGFLALIAPNAQASNLQT